MACPKCGCKTVFRTAEALTSNVSYTCSACGFKWVDKGKMLLVDRKHGADATQFGLPWWSKNEFKS